MADNNKLKETNIKSAYYYFFDIINIYDLIFKKFPWIKIIPFIILHKKALHGVKPPCIIFDKVDGCIKEYDEIRCLGLLPPDERMFDRIRYFNISGS